MRHVLIICLALMFFVQSGIGAVTKTRYRCTPNTQFKIDCNTCGCGPDGYLAYCTKIACPHPHLDNSDVDPAIPNTVVDKYFIAFQRFVKKYEKTYRNVQEYEIRFKIFQNTQKEIEEINSKGGHVSTGQYDDRTRLEMMEIYGIIIGALDSRRLD